MDDTIECLLPAWVDELNKKHGTNVDPNEIHDWSIQNAFPSLTTEQVYAPLFDDQFWDNVKPMPGAIKYMSRLLADGHDLYIVTNSHYKTLASKFDRVLFKYFPFIDLDHVIIAPNKQMIRGDVLIDDGVHNHIGGRYLKILMDAPHNRSVSASKYGIIRVKSWAGAYCVICDYVKTPWMIDTIFGLKGTRNIHSKKDVAIK